MQQRLEEEIEKVFAAIEYLQHKDIIQPVENNIATYYRVNPDKDHVIAQLIKSFQDKSE